MLEDPRVNFAISARPGRAAGISHLGIQVEDEAELVEVYDRLARAERPTIEAKGTTCCYVQSDKLWIADPQGVPWETFLTYGESTVYGEGSLARLKSEAACCEPEAIRQATPEPAAASASCAREGPQNPRPWSTVKGCRCASSSARPRSRTAMGPGSSSTKYAGASLGSN
jgi:hypothetical protein